MSVRIHSIQIKVGHALRPFQKNDVPQAPDGHSRAFLFVPFHRICRCKNERLLLHSTMYQAAEVAYEAPVRAHSRLNRLVAGGHHESLQGQSQHEFNREIATTK